MGHRHGRHLALKLLEGVDDVLLGLGVERARRLVEEEEERAGVERSSDSEPLPLPPAQADAPLADTRIEALATVAQEVCEVSPMQGLPDKVVIDRIPRESEGDVLSHRPLDECDVLGDVGDGPGPEPHGVLGRDAADQDLAHLWLKDPENDVGEGRLAGTGRTDKSD